MNITNPSSPVELLQALISIPSVNPEGVSKADLDTGHFGEQRIAEALIPLLENAGFSVILEEVEPGRPNLIARAPGSNDRPRIFFGPHLDTVSVKTMVIPPFSGELKDGKIWGRGSTDTKGSMASMIWALIKNADLLADAPVAIDFIAFMGEETQQLGSKHFAKHHADEYEFGIAGEPTSLQIVNCTKGCLWATLSAKGKAVHASKPHLGENAILKLFNSFSALTNALDVQFSKLSHPVLGKTTWNLGLFNGGTSPNIVADEASLTLDIRTIPALWEQGGAEELIERLSKDLEVTFLCHEENPPMEVSPENKWIKAIQKAQPTAKCVGAPWFSDAAHLNAGGIPSICLGPGVIDQAHTEDEYITVADYEAGVEFFTELVSDLLKR